MQIANYFYSLYSFLNLKLDLSFKEKDTEQHFQTDYLNGNLKQNRVALIIAFLAYLSYYPVSYFLTPEDFYFNAYFTLPVPIFFSLYFYATFNQIKDNKILVLKLSVFAVIICAPPIINLPITETHHQVYITNLMLPLFAMYSMFGAPFVVALLSSTVLIIIFFICLSFTSLNLGELLYSTFLVIITFTISAIAGYNIERNQRRNYLAKYEQETLNQLLMDEQEKLLKNEKIMQQQTRLAQMGEMISMIAHQWRQPLGAINTAMMGIDNKVKSGQFDFTTEEDRTLFFNFMYKKHKNINQYIHHLSETIDDFRNFFKPDKKQQWVTLNSPVEKALQIVQTSLNTKGIKVETKLNHQDKLFLFNNEIMQVILNLLKNAEDNFIERIHQKQQLTPAFISIQSHAQDDLVVLTICDNGGGIPTDIIDYIFDPYFSTKEEKNGSGLGLYMSKIMIEEHHNGALEVKNDSDGVCFSISLPVTPSHKYDNT